MKNEITIGALIGWIAAAVVCMSQMGCSFKLEAGYHGKTGRDDLTASPELTQASVKSRRY